jgi:hypothetical protein
MPDQAEPTIPPYGAISAIRYYQVVGDAIQWWRISTYSSGAQIVDEHTDTSTTANGATTISSKYSRTHYIGEIDGSPSTQSTGHTTIVGSSLHLTWQLHFTDSQGLVTHQNGATAQTFEGVVQETGVQSVTTGYPDGTATQIHIQWSRPSLTGDAIRRTQVTDPNNNTTTISDHAWSSGNGPWQTSGAQPTRYDDDPSLDALPPPFGPMGPVIGGDPIFVMNEPPLTPPTPPPPPTPPSTGST